MNQLKTLFKRLFKPNNSNIRKLRDLTRTHRNVDFAFTDLGYLLGNRPNSAEEFEPLRQSFTEGLDWWMEILRLFENGEGIVWAQKRHVENEPNWENSITFVMKMLDTYRKILQWVAQDDKMALKCIEMAAEKLCKRPIEAIPIITEGAVSKKHKHENS